MLPTRAGTRLVIVKTSDPLSVHIGEYYAARRHIIFQNIIRVVFPPGRTTLTSKEFVEIKARADEQALPHIQAYALTWAAPYRVDLHVDHFGVRIRFRPGILRNGLQDDAAQPVLRFGRENAADHSDRGHLLRTGEGTYRPRRGSGRIAADRHRLPAFHLGQIAQCTQRVLPAGRTDFQRRMRVRTRRQDALLNVDDALFNFPGNVSVQGLDTLHFVLGAIADHLTSAGGMLTDSSQMSTLRWLEAGATGSYGTVVEPCALPQKFPDPVVVREAYLRGETLIEAYWKSVAMPGQGIFIGEPLAAPFRSRRWCAEVGGRAWYTPVDFARISPALPP